MAEGNGSRDRVTKWIRWIARIWSLPIMAGALLVLVGYVWSWATSGAADPYAVEDYPPMEALPPIFVFLSIVGLGIAWRWERLGGMIVMVFQLVVLVLLFMTSPLTQDFPRLAVPYLLWMIITIPGVLFLVCGWRPK
jgi:hypothetical protein